jgi:hypothetical protein
METMDMKKTLIIAAAAMLIGSSGLSFAGSSGTKGCVYGKPKHEHIGDAVRPG